MVVAIRKSLVALPHVRVGNQRRHLKGRERGEIRFAVVAGDGREHRRTVTTRREALDDGQQQLLLGARAMRLCLDDDAMPSGDGSEGLTS